MISLTISITKTKKWWMQRNWYFHYYKKYSLRKTNYTLTIWNIRSKTMSRMFFFQWKRGREQYFKIEFVDQMEVSSFSMLVFFDTSKSTYQVCKESCERKFYQSAKLLLNLPAILTIHTYRATSNVHGKINKTPV